MRGLSRAHQFLTFTTPPKPAGGGRLRAGKDDTYFEEMRAGLGRSRDRLAAGLVRLGFTVLPMPEPTFYRSISATVGRRYAFLRTHGARARRRGHPGQRLLRAGRGAQPRAPVLRQDRCDPRCRTRPLGGNEASTVSETGLPLPCRSRGAGPHPRHDHARRHSPHHRPRACGRGADAPSHRHQPGGQPPALGAARSSHGLGLCRAGHQSSRSASMP